MRADPHSVEMSTDVKALQRHLDKVPGGDIRPHYSRTQGGSSRTGEHGDAHCCVAVDLHLWLCGTAGDSGIWIALLGTWTFCAFSTSRVAAQLLAR